MKEYKEFWTNYANFKGITTRRGYWMAYLMNFIVSTVLGIITAIIPVLSFITWIYSLAVIIPSLSIAVRRLRDAGKGWGWLFINLIPLIGQIIFIVMLCLKTKEDRQPIVVA